MTNMIIIVISVIVICVILILCREAGVKERTEKKEIILKQIKEEYSSDKYNKQKLMKIYDECLDSGNSYEEIEGVSIFDSDKAKIIIEVLDEKYAVKGLNYTEDLKARLQEKENELFLKQQRQAKIMREAREKAGLESQPDYSSLNGQSKEKSVIGQAVAGGIIAGPAGAVVGAINAVDKNNKIRSEKK